MEEMLVLTVRQACRRGVLVAVLIALSTGGCSSVPDAVNPVEWYKGTRDWISGDDKPAAAKRAEVRPVPGADRSFPKLDSVPERPAQSTAAEREKMANSLIADRDAARYSNEQFRRQDSSIATASLPQAASASPVPAPKPAQAPPPPLPVVSSQTMVPQATSSPVAAAQPFPLVPNQPIPVIPNRAPQSVGLLQPPQPAQMPTVSSISPPPPPVVVGSSARPPDAFPPRPLHIPERPPVVNPSGGGTAYIPPAPPTQRAEVFFDPDRFATRFPSDANLPQWPGFETPVSEIPSFEIAQSLQPNSPPVATILFAYGSARIGDGDRQVIRQVYDEYRRRGGRIYVIGHASSRTRNLDQASHQLANFSISYERARSVAGLLERLGVPPQAIVVTAMSDQEPSNFEVMPAGEAGNRRVEIYFTN